MDINDPMLQDRMLLLAEEAFAAADEVYGMEDVEAWGELFTTPESVSSICGLQ